MSDRIEPIRATQGSVPPVARVERRKERREEQPPDRRRRERPAKPSITRDDDGTPHIDVRA